MMEEKERNRDTPLGVPGGHNLPYGDCMADGGSGGDGCRLQSSDFKPQGGGRSLTLPRYVKDGGVADSGEESGGGARSDGDRKASAHRKVDSLPSNFTLLSLDQEKRHKRRGLLRSVGIFIQKITRRFSLSGSAVNGGFKAKLGQRGSVSTASSSNSSNGGTAVAVVGDSGTPGGRRSENDSAAGSSHALDRGPAGAPGSASCLLTLDEIPGMVGIHNHGNTCFMNAVVQCLSNTEPLLSYFLSDQYKEDVRRANKRNSKRFGTRGELTEHLATLLKSLWLKKYTPDISTEFRTIVGKYGPQYRGSFQHDVQEFLAWLLDKVHEDLNIATKKKYRANKSSFGRTDEDVAAEAMANHARCNNSFIHDLFQALYRSSLTCPTCRHQSNTFDPFLSVSLPIPRTSPVQPVLVACLRVGGAASARRTGVVLERGHTVGDLKEELGRTFFEGLAPSELLVLEVTGKNEFHLLDSSRLISDPMNNELLYAMDVSVQSRSTTDDVAVKGPSDKLLGPSKPDQWDHVIHRPASRLSQTSSPGPTKRLEAPNGGRDSLKRQTNGIAAPASGQSKLPAGRESRGSSRLEIEAVQCQERVDNSDMSLVIVMNLIPCEDNEKKLSMPTLLRLPVSALMSDRLERAIREAHRVPEELESKVFLIADGGPSNFSKLELPRDVPESHEELQQVKRSLIQTASCSVEEPGKGSLLPVFRVLVEWKDAQVRRHFRFVEDVEEDTSVHEATRLQLQANVGTLDECFQVYTQEEMLGEDNDWHCPSCREPKRGATKSLTLWSLPEILVIHLKRFRQDHEHRSKLNTLIQFPLTGLDLRRHMPRRGPTEGEESGDQGPPGSVQGPPGLGGNWNAAMQMKSSKQQSSWLSWRLGCKMDGSLYDLYAVCNHYGDMQGGHYTAFCRNPVTGTWCLFNDSRASLIKEDEVVTRAAYLLFYRKRSADAQEPTRLAENEGVTRPGDISVGGMEDCSRRGNLSPVGLGTDGTAAGSMGRAVPPVLRSGREGQVDVPLSSIESRPWLVALLEERRRLHGLSHTITTRVDGGSHRISRAVTSHSLDDLLDGDCDDSRENDFQGVPIYTTLHPPPRIKKQVAKAPMATISMDSVPTACVGDPPVARPETNGPANSHASDQPGSSTVRCSMPEKVNGDARGSLAPPSTKANEGKRAVDRGEVTGRLNQTAVRQKLLEGID